jgi:hypothetical protein
MAILAGFFVAITLSREISGGHINPGVTLTVYLAEEDPKEKSNKANQSWMFLVSQIAGATSAALLGMAIYNENVFKMAPSPNSSSAEALVMEIVGSCLFYTIILVQGNKDAELCKDKTVSTLVITAGLASGIAMAGNISGGCLNPSLAFGFNFVRLLATGKIEECRYLWLYILGPVGGAFLASYFYINFYCKSFETETHKKEINEKFIEKNRV